MLDNTLISRQWHLTEGPAPPSSLQPSHGLLQSPLCTYCIHTLCPFPYAFVHSHTLYMYTTFTYAIKVHALVKQMDILRYIEREF